MNEGGSAPPGAPAIRRQRSARALLRLDLAVLGAGFAWFAYIDAPITDGAMRLVAGAVLAGLLTMVATLVAGESSSERVSRRWWRVSLWAFGLTTLLMLTAVTVTLNLKGTGSDDADTTAVVRRA
jgi:hypothetical protein